MTILISPRRVTLLFSIVVAALSVVHGAGQISRFYLGDGHLHGLVPMFTFGSEHNVPAYYSSLAILFCALLLGVIAAGERQRGTAQARYRGAWRRFSFTWLWTRRWPCTNAI